MLSERTFQTGGGIKLNLAAGPPQGPPVLLLHGVTRRWQDFVSLLPALACRRQVFALDFRGHGASARDPGKRYRIADHVEDVLAVLHDAVPAPAVLYGHSMGALVALAAAARAPDRVRAIVLEDPPAPRVLGAFHETAFYPLFKSTQALAGRKGTVQELTRLLGAVSVPGPAGPTCLAELRDPTALRFGARCLQDADPEVLSPLLESAWLHGLEYPRLTAQVRCPVLLLCGEEACGGMLPRRDADDLASRLADCLRCDLPGVGHLLHWMATETVVRLTLGFLESLR